MLLQLACIVKEVRLCATKLVVTIHQMSTFATDHTGATNAPEGVHQDGDDFIGVIP